MENLNLNLQELECIAYALWKKCKQDSPVKQTINKAIEACKAKEESDNDYAKKFYKTHKFAGVDAGARVRYSCTVNLTLQHTCHQI